MRALADRLDRVLGRSDQARDRGVFQFRMVAHQPENGVRTILALGNRGVARALAFGFRHANLGRCDLQLVRRIFLGPFDLVARELSVHQRIQPLDPLSRLAIGDRLDLQRVHRAEFCDLVEGKRGVVDEPDGRRFRHQELLGHEYNPSHVPLRRGGAWM